MYMVLKGGEKTSRGGGVHMDFDSHMQAGLISHNVGSMDYGDVPMSSMMALQQQQQHHQTLANNHHHQNHQHHQHLMTYNNPTSSTPTSLITTTNNNSSNIPSPSHPHPHPHHHHSDMNGEPLYQPSLFQAYYGNQVGGSHYLLPLQEPPQDHDLKHHLTNNKISSSSSMPVHAVDSGFRISESEAMRAQIMSHPQYPQLVTAYLNCQKVGAPPEIVAGLDELSREYPNHLSIRTTVGFGSDPDLDQFMEDYCNLLQRYHEELTTPFKEAMSFFRKIELQLNSLSKGSVKFSHSGEAEEKEETNASSEEDGSSGEIEFHDADPLAEEAKLKEKLLRKYSGYISALKHEFLKKKKKGKLPKEARQKLLDWWNQHYKWPYPSETEKTWLAESTGLDQKQINNWFINQRKRHWKPSEDLIHYSLVEDSNNTATATANHHYSPVNPFPDSATLKAQMGLLPMDQF